MVAVGVAGALAAGAAVAVWPGGARGSAGLPETGPVSAPSAPPSSTPATLPGDPPSYVATLSSAVTYSAAPGGPPVGNLAATNPFGTKQVLAVIGKPDRSGWLHVELPVRPNGSTGWIPAAGVALQTTAYRVSVDLAAHTLSVTRGGATVLTTPVAVGAPGTPTPAGDTYLWELIRPDDPTGAYGPYIFGLAEFSDVYATFNGGNAQIGIHGQDEPWSVGQAVSHGCVRLGNDVITQLAAMLPLGTPVSIS